MTTRTRCALMVGQVVLLLGGSIEVARGWQQTAWRLTRDPQIKGSEENVEQAPLDPVRVFRLPDGRYVVGDGDQNGWHALLVYDRQGKFLAKWGGKGRGPGEFSQLFLWAGVYRGDSVAAYDQRDKSLRIFSREGKFARTLTIPRNAGTLQPTPGTFGASEYFIGPLADGRVLRFESAVLNVSSGEGSAWYEPDLTVYDVNGAAPKKLMSLRTWGYWWDGKKAAQQPFLPAALTVAGKDVWYHGTAEDFSIRVFDPSGRLLRTLRRPLARERVTAEDKESFIRWMVDLSTRGPRGNKALGPQIEERLRNARFAEFKPVYSNLVEDSEGNLWVEHFRWFGDEQRPDPRPTRWSIFDKQGRFLGEVEVPAAFIISSITNDQVLGIWKDEFDVEHVHVYGLLKR